MISNQDFTSILSEQVIHTEKIQECEGFTPNKNHDKMLIKKKFQFIFDNDNKKIVYILDGRILRCDYCEPFEMMMNFEQIMYLNWKGDWNQNQKKNGKWVALWKDDYFGVGGFYSENGLKFGVWKEMFKNFWDNAEVFEIGEYRNGIRIGQWDFVFEKQKIGGGFYKENGLKNGSWIELSQNFSSFSQIFQKGDYQDDKKLGLWQTFYRGRSVDSFTKIGGGSFNENLKDGDWIELSEYFSNLSQVVYKGLYKLGKKQGKWETMYRVGDESKFEIIGGGYYDENGMKQSKWIEPYNCFQSYVQITFSGEYQNDLKIGSWQTNFREYGGDKYSQTGGGSFDQKGMKVGSWIELSEVFNRDFQLIYQGEYQNGQKTGIWNTMYRKEVKNQFKNIGGGLYDLNGKKDGIWEELEDQLSRNVSIVYKGEYKKDKKQGNWVISSINGGGYFNENGRKEGQWIEFYDYYDSQYYLIFQGKYQNGRRIGQWDIIEMSECRYDQEDFKFQNKIGGGNYDQNGEKNGKWLDLDYNYDMITYKVTYLGEYKNGVKIGLWKILYRENNSKPIKQRNWGQFDQAGIKVGIWDELQDRFKMDIIIRGEYKNGQKTGVWSLMKKDSENEGELNKMQIFSLNLNLAVKQILQMHNEKIDLLNKIKNKYFIFSLFFFYNYQFQPILYFENQSFIFKSQKHFQTSKRQLEVRFLQQ
ncbi:unnamed protein product [Paramecium sonneborni]|uniref:Uncharacterized protein n=1 Tax=Paramecium sonneborni TaxID=65129 RepID=A0A8S1QN35_9CILI|nr:unnamed protein product [Paramecium sonneborni]